MKQNTLRSCQTQSLNVKKEYTGPREAAEHKDGDVALAVWFDEENAENSDSTIDWDAFIEKNKAFDDQLGVEQGCPTHFTPQSRSGPQGFSQARWFTPGDRLTA